MIFTRSLSIFFSLSLGVYITFTKATTFHVVNQCPYTVWVAGSPLGGWQLNTGKSRSFTVNPGTKISQIWGRTNCSVDDDGRTKCQTGDCSGLLQCQNLGSPPLTLAEINLNVDNNLDFMDISLVFGFNIPMSFGPATNVCRTIQCSGDIIEQCPEDLQAPGGCYSACKVFKTGEYCCPGLSCGPTEYSRFFKKKCPNAHTYPYDDAESNFTCPAGTNYKVVFCPSKRRIEVQDHDSPQDYVNAHNAARTEVGVGSITWNDTVAAYAQNYANQHIGDCNLVHSGGPYGENLAWGSDDLSGTDAVKMWVDERANYDHNSNSCAQGAVCGHYTQVVWRNSVRLGCAKVRCNNGGTFIVCNYDPRGNYIGQRPY